MVRHPRAGRRPVDPRATSATPRGSTASTRHIRYDHRVVSAEWDRDVARWTVTVETAEGTRRLTCAFLWSCTGYFDYDQGHQPDLPGIADFAGDVLHPQHWPEDFDHAGKRIVVIGSGATAVTLVPALAETAAHVTMLQRSPTYILSVPSEDGLAGQAGQGAAGARGVRRHPLEEHPHRQRALQAQPQPPASRARA